MRDMRSMLHSHQLDLENLKTLRNLHCSCLTHSRHLQWMDLHSIQGALPLGAVTSSEVKLITKLCTSVIHYSKDSLFLQIAVTNSQGDGLVPLLH